MPPPNVIRPQTSAAQKRRAAPRQLAVVGQGFGEAHRYAGADRGGHADEERVPGIMRGEGGGEDRREGRDRTVHQPDKAGLDDLQHEAAPGVLVLAGAHSLREGGWPRFAPRRSRARPRRRRDRPAACGSPHPWCGSPPAGRNARRPAPSGAPAGARRRRRAGGTCQTGRRCTQPRTSCRRTSGMWSPNFATKRSISWRRCSLSSAAMSSKTFALAG